MPSASRIRITESTPTRLSFEARQSVWARAVLWTAVVFIVCFTASKTRMSCVRGADGTLTYTQEWRFLGITLHRSVVSGDVRAHLRYSEEHSSRGELILLVPGGRTGVYNWSGFTSKHKEELARFGRFLRSSQAGQVELVLPQHPFFGAFAILFALASILAARPTIVSLDKARDELQVIKPGIGKSRRSVRPLSTVDSFAIVQRFENLAEDPPDWMEKHCPNLLRSRQPESERTVLVLVARLKNGKEVGIFSSMLGGEKGMRFIRELEQFRKTATSTHAA